MARDEVPEPYRELLAHDHHMTVTVESFHRSPVDVQVLAVHRDGDVYCRRILLRRQIDQQVVQFGIVRLNLNALSAKVREQIESARIPLGRVLIQNNVLRDVELKQLFQVHCGRDLAEQFAVAEGTTTFGRTAIIHCEGEPAVELLEVVAPAAPYEGMRSS